MKYFFIHLLGFFMGQFCLSQSLTPEVLGNSGDHNSSASLQLSWTIGEPVIDTYIRTISNLTLGFHQTQLIITELQNEFRFLEVNVFPNPTSDILNVQLSEEREGLTVQFIDLAGRILITQTTGKELLESLEISKFTLSQYFLRILDEQQQKFKSCKIQIIKGQ